MKQRKNSKMYPRHLSSETVFFSRNWCKYTVTLCLYYFDCTVFELIQRDVERNGYCSYMARPGNQQIISFGLFPLHVSHNFSQGYQQLYNEEQNISSHACTMLYDIQVNSNNKQGRRQYTHHYQRKFRWFLIQA